jgi:hypothetical protein
MVVEAVYTHCPDEVFRFAFRWIASHPSAQNALGWGTPQVEWYKE